jgi:hypothetical protein
VTSAAQTHDQRQNRNLGEGQSFSVVEAHTLLMCWARVA